MADLAAGPGFLNKFVLSPGFAGAFFRNSLRKKAAASDLLGLSSLVWSAQFCRLRDRRVFCWHQIPD